MTNATEPVRPAALALLIDAARLAGPDRLGDLCEALAARGRLGVRRAYGDWTAPALAGWSAALLAHAVQPVQLFAGDAQGGAATGALIVDAMDLLHAGGIDGVCLVPGSAALLPLALRLREAGVRMLGIDDGALDGAFAASCDELLAPTPGARMVAPAGKSMRVIATPPAGEVRPAPKLAPPAFPSAPQSAAELAADARLIPMLTAAMAECAAEEGWAWLGAVGQRLRRLQPDFDPRCHGYARLTELVEACGCFEMSRRGGSWHARPAIAPTGRAE
ncbi:NYN domain-containing protein [Derxia lacustris]|uniref:NYN domain-containing protein n=1 Tax=Derxia lacustris TaxID=764842 RepID=UPI000A1777A8|nr:NYN domain-containing protein [Derxia lacustris]